MRTISVPLIAVVALAALGFGAPGVARAQAGSDLWLRYDPIADEAARSAYRRAVSAIVVSSDTATGRIVKDELQRGLRGLLGAEVPVTGAVTGAGAVIAGTPGTSPLIAALGWTEALDLAGDEGYLIRSATVGGHAATVIASRGEAGALYGAFHFLRLIQTEAAASRDSTSPSGPAWRFGC